MTHAQILTAITERETSLAAIVRKYGFAPVNVPPLFACTARDMAVIVDKLERKLA